jgi:uncharacterized protein YneF (UPF0154 family)
MKIIIEILAFIGFASIAFGTGFAIGYWLCRREIIKLTDSEAERLINWINHMPV